MKTLASTLAICVALAAGQFTASAPTPKTDSNKSNYCKKGHAVGQNPCSPAGTDYCCESDCTYCGSQDYCDNFSPEKADSGVCNSAYVPPAGDDVCQNFYVPCIGPYCKDEHPVGTNPCSPAGTGMHPFNLWNVAFISSVHVLADYCCESDCTYCGSQDFCDNFSPEKTDSGVCNSAYVPPAGDDVCQNYYTPCSNQTGSVLSASKISIKNKSVSKNKTQVKNNKSNKSNQSNQPTTKNKTNKSL
jgi:hypothetical protein